MQLDNTRIAVRERGMIDTYDLTWHVIRNFAPRLVPALLAPTARAVGWVPALAAFAVSLGLFALAHGTTVIGPKGTSCSQFASPAL